MGATLRPRREETGGRIAGRHVSAAAGPVGPAGGLSGRPIRQPDLDAERGALRELSWLIATSPAEVADRAVELALDMCGAGSARLSLAEVDGDGRTTFAWTAVASAIAPHNGALSCAIHADGLSLDGGDAILIEEPGRLCPDLAQEWPAISEALVAPLRGPDGRLLGAFWLFHHDGGGRFDATDARHLELLGTMLVPALELVAAADTRTRALRAKDLAIREAHHRSKDMIVSAATVLRMEAMGSGSAQARDALRRAMDRLQALARAQELLQRRADDGTSLDVAELIGGLTDGLRRSFPEMDGRVRLDVELDALSLDPDRAVPLALLVNEAVTNAYEHAFPDGRTGTIAVVLRATGTDGTSAISLTVRDDGVGMPATRREGSLGLRLIEGFGRQVGGELTMAGQEGGTAVTLRLPRPEARRP